MDLGLAWYADLDTARGQEGTPLVIDGKIYITTAWSKVKAYDAATGKRSGTTTRRCPAKPAPRRAATWSTAGSPRGATSSIFGTLDGRLVALDRDTGKEAWSTLTVDQSRAYTITGAPRVINGKVIIGNSGAELGVRGYVTAYDANERQAIVALLHGARRAGDAGTEPEYLAKARATWKGECWKLGGGGTVWDAMAYDPGARPALHRRRQRIAVEPGATARPAAATTSTSPRSSRSGPRPANTSGTIRRRRRRPGTSPRPSTSCSPTSTIGGKPRKVLMQAPKNGFFYVLDRANGRADLAPTTYVPQNWTTRHGHGDRPPDRAARGALRRHRQAVRLGVPARAAATAGTRWRSAPTRGWSTSRRWKRPSRISPSRDGSPTQARDEHRHRSQRGGDAARRRGRARPLTAATKGVLIAWDPVARRSAGACPTRGLWNGGLLATAGGLLFQGNAEGNLVAYAAKDGKELWSFFGQTGIIAPPITYGIGGEQYVAVLAGWGGVWPLSPGRRARPGQDRPLPNISRLLVFKLGGTAKLPPLELQAARRSIRRRSGHRGASRFGRVQLRALLQAVP